MRETFSLNVKVTIRCSCPLLIPDSRLNWSEYLAMVQIRSANTLMKKGALVLSSKGFFVKGNSLEDGELEHAASWAKEIIKNNK